MRRVLLVFDPPDGGVAENVRRLALGLRAHDWEPYVAGPKESVIYDDLRAEGVPFTRLSFMPNYNHLLSDLATVRQLRRIIQREGFDLLHCHNAKAGILTRAAVADRQEPLVYSPHCFPFVAPFSEARRKVSAGLERTFGPRTEIVLCVADAEREVALEYQIAPAARLRVVHNGCPPCDRELELDSEIETFRAGRPLAATLCVLREQKAVHVFLDAAAEILERCPDAVLAVIGNGELEDELRRQAAGLGLAERFRFFPFRQPGSRQLASIDVLVLPSSWEAFPISILEAMACGVPQVATDVGGTREAVVEGKTGYLCPPEDPAILADRVSRLLSDHDLRRSMGQAAAERYEESFRVETMVEKSAVVYDEALSEAARTPDHSWRETISGLKRAATKRLPSVPVREASSGSAR